MEEFGRFGVIVQVLSTRCHMVTTRRLSNIHILSYTVMCTPQSLPISATQEEWEGPLPKLTNLRSEYHETLNVQVRAEKILSDHSEGLDLLSLKAQEVLKYSPCKSLRFWLNLDKLSQSLLLRGDPFLINALFSMRHPPRDTEGLKFSLYSRWSATSAWNILRHRQWNPRSQWLLTVWLKVFTEQKWEMTVTIRQNFISESLNMVS